MSSNISFFQTSKKFRFQVRKFCFLTCSSVGSEFQSLSLSSMCKFKVVLPDKVDALLHISFQRTCGPVCLMPVPNLQLLSWKHGQNKWDFLCCLLQQNRYSRKELQFVLKQIKKLKVDFDGPIAEAGSCLCRVHRAIFFISFLSFIPIFVLANTLVFPLIW